MTPTSLTRLGWAVESVALVGCGVLVANGTTTIYAAGKASIAVVALVVVAVGSAAAMWTRFAPPRMSPLLLTVLLPGLLVASTARLNVVGFAAGALLAAAAAYAAGGQTAKGLRACLIVVAFAACAARLFLRDPFRERRCAPACSENPLLIVRSPEVLHGCEVALGAVTMAWALIASVHVVRRRARGDVGASLIVYAMTAAWAARLLVQPRPAPEDLVDQWLFVAMVGAAAVAALLRSLEPIEVAITRSRITRFARSLSDAGDLVAIAERIRSATGDRSVVVELGGDGTVGNDPATTAVVRGGRVVATIRHSPASRRRIAEVVTPAVALALETQLVLQEARSQLVALEQSRAMAVQVADEARRRLERDLHDGAQQRLLLVGMRLAHAAAERSDSRDERWQVAADDVAEALAELRRIGRGDAAIIAELGLDNAVTSLAATADVPVEVTSESCATPGHECWPLSPATTAYRLVVSSIDDAELCREALAVHLRCLGPGEGRTITTMHNGPSATDRASDHDRVLAAAGHVIVHDADITDFTAWLP